MPHRSNDDLVREIRDRRTKEIQECSERAAQKISARLSKGKLAVDVLAEIISEEFSELNR
jgi:hypothetical protein